jgi:peptidyl-prolyl cis-trans isomerase SurA
MTERAPQILPIMDLLRNLTFAVLIGAVGSLLAGPAAAQQPGEIDLFGSDDRVDRIVAVVGDSVIVESEIQERMLQLQAQGTDLPDDPAARNALQRDLLETMINEKLIVNAALEDTTVAVNESRVDEIVDQDLQQRMQAFGGEGAMREALRAQGMTMSAFREMLRSDARQQQLQNQYLGRRQGSASSIAVSEEEMRSFFEENRARLGDRPATVTFEQIVVQPGAADSASASARTRAEALLDSLRAGADFQELARRHSDDPGTREDQGGGGGDEQARGDEPQEDAFPGGVRLPALCP